VLLLQLEVEFVTENFVFYPAEDMLQALLELFGDALQLEVAIVLSSSKDQISNQF